MFVFAPYMGSGGLVTGGGSTVKNDATVFSMYPKAHSVGVACRHLSTYIALTRGIPFSEITPGFDASPMANVSGFNAYAPPVGNEKPPPPPPPPPPHKDLPGPVWFDAPAASWRHAARGDRRHERAERRKHP